MYDNSFYLTVWIILGGLGLPIIFAWVISLLMDAKQRKDAKNNAKPPSIKQLLEVIGDGEKSPEEALEAVREFEHHYGDFSKIKDEESAFSLLREATLREDMDIDHITKMQKHLKEMNGAKGKEIEKVISEALKKRKKR